MKLMILGDTHCNLTETLGDIVHAAHHVDIDLIIQIGDFGIWDTNWGYQFLSGVNNLLDNLGLELWFIDGNHEDFHFLDRLRESPTDVQPLINFENIYHIQRGSIFTLGNKVAMGVGGAVSIDKKIRIVGESWWPEEEITNEQQDFVIKQATRFSPDILFTHDAPTNVPMSYLKDDPESTVHRQKLKDIGMACSPHRWFHGHYHAFMNYEFPMIDPNTYVHGLGRDGDVNNWVIYDTDEDKVYPAKLWNKLKIGD